MNEKRLPRVVHAEVLDDRSVRITFDDGVVRDVDLTPFLTGPVFAQIRRDAARFRELRVDSELGTIVWPNEADIAPETLYESGTQVSAV